MGLFFKPFFWEPHGCTDIHTYEKVSFILLGYINIIVLCVSQIIHGY